MKRAGIEVETTGIKGIDVSGSHGISIIADHSFDEISESYDVYLYREDFPDLQILLNMNR